MVGVTAVYRTPATDTLAMSAIHEFQTGRRTRGFTLLELLIAMAVAAILLAIATPSYRSVVQRNSIAANVNDLVGDVNYARSEAVTRGQDVYICSSTNQLDCNGGENWSSGWVVYAATDPSTSSPVPTADNRLRVRGRTTADFELAANGDSLRFNSNGFAMAGNTFTAKAGDVSRTTTISVAATGRVEINRDSPS